MEKSEKTFTHWQLWDTLLNLARCMWSSKQGRTEMGILMGKTCFDKLRMQLIFLKQRQMVLQLAFFCSTMPQATRNEHQMHSLHGRCQKNHMRHDDTTKMDQKCGQQPLEPITPPKTSTSLRTIQQCQGGSRGWKPSSMNVGFGHSEG